MALKSRLCMVWLFVHFGHTLYGGWPFVRHRNEQVNVKTPYLHSIINNYPLTLALLSSPYTVFQSANSVTVHLISLFISELGQLMD